MLRFVKVLVFGREKEFAGGVPGTGCVAGDGWGCRHSGCHQVARMVPRSKLAMAPGPVLAGMLPDSLFLRPPACPAHATSALGTPLACLIWNDKLLYCYVALIATFDTVSLITCQPDRL